jgi:N-acetylglucosaminyldiphosphoundecaprenol N-acetyl-beta-D-mannosaminyltransferase
MQTLKRIAVLGYPFDAVTFNETVALLRRALLENQPLQILSGNPDFELKTPDCQPHAQELWQAAMLAGSGVPLLRAAETLETQWQGRLNRTALVWECARLSAELGCGIALLGVAPAVSQRAAQKLRSRFPQAQVYALPPLFEQDELAHAALRTQLRAVNAQLILAATGQERLLKQQVRNGGALVGIGCGAALDLIGATPATVAQVTSNRGLDWFYYMLQKSRPQRKRAVAEASPSTTQLLAALARQRLMQ